MNKSKNKTTMIIFALLFFVFIVLIISISKIDKQTENTTTLYTATVSRVNIVDTGRKIFTEIHTKEYKNSLLIDTDVNKNINISDVENLQSGDLIFFRIENIKVKQINSVEFINIVSLKTQSKEVFSLEDYNQYIFKSAYPARIICFTLALASLLVSLIFYWRQKRQENGSPEK